MFPLQNIKMQTTCPQPWVFSSSFQTIYGLRVQINLCLFFPPASSSRDKIKQERSVWLNCLADELYGAAALRPSADHFDKLTFFFWNKAHLNSKGRGGGCCGGCTHTHTHTPVWRCESRRHLELMVFIPFFVCVFFFKLHTLICDNEISRGCVTAARLTLHSQTIISPPVPPADTSHQRWTN